MQIISIIAICLTLFVGHVLTQHYAGPINHSGYKDRFRTIPTDTGSQATQSTANLDSRFDAGLLGTQRPPSGSYLVVQPDDINIAQNQITNSNNLPNKNQEGVVVRSIRSYIGPAAPRNQNTQLNQENNEISNRNALSGGFSGYGHSYGAGSQSQAYTTSQGFDGRSYGAGSRSQAYTTSQGFDGISYGAGSQTQAYTSQDFGGQSKGAGGKNQPFSS